MKGSSRISAQRIRRECGVVCQAYPQGQFTCPEEDQFEGTPENARRFLGIEANACGFRKGDRGMILL